jgi:hypothetical protein
MDKFIHRENLALFRKRLAEASDDATRQILLKLLAEEEAKEPSSQPKSKSSTGGASNSPSCRLSLICGNGSSVSATPSRPARPKQN